MKAFPFLVLALSLAVRCPADDGVIRTANELNGLSDAQAAEKRRFELSGTIVFVSGCPDTNLGQSFVMSVEGTNVSVAIGHPATSPTTGDVIRVAGHSYGVQRDIYAESKGFSRKGRKAHAAQSTCLRSLTR